MLRTLARVCIDALIPPAATVTRAHRVPTSELESLLRLRVHDDHPFIYSALPYSDERVRLLIKAAKYHACERSATRLGTLVGDALLEVAHESAVTHGFMRPQIVAVAQSRARRKDRGYNQAERIAVAASKASGIPLLAHALTREDRQSQVHVRRSERARNIRGAFQADAARVRGAYILLVDDVVESGATLEDARRALLDAGAAGVVCLAVAH